MAELRPVFQNIANAIREKNGLADTYTPEQMPDAIKAIEGGGGTEPPADVLVLSGNCYDWYNGKQNKWFFDTFKNKITTKDITRATSMFSGYQGETFPFDININNSNVGQDWYDYMFSYSKNLTIAPNINFTPFTKLSSIDFTNMYRGCNKLKNVPSDIFEKITNALKDTVWINPDTGWCELNLFFDECYFLEAVPKMNSLYQVDTKISFSYSIRSCYNIKEIDLPVAKRGWHSNLLTGYNSTPRLKHITFDKNREYYPEGIVLGWNNQNINFTSVGYEYANAIIPEELAINDDETYQALKNNPDAWAQSIEYSFYNHDSAVETINSLPNTSGTNIIKFTGNSGSKTDGGAINTLTPEEIAVATAKGFTVTLVQGG